MSRRSIFTFLVVSALAACTSRNVGTSATPPGPGEVKMKLTCLPDGSLGVSLVPWRVRLPDEHAAFVFINDPNSDTDGVINTKDPQFPFGGQPFTTGKGATVRKNPIKGTPKNDYKYSITATCQKAGGGSETTVVDPDMIIPWNIQ